MHRIPRQPSQKWTLKKSWKLFTCHHTRKSNHIFKKLKPRKTKSSKTFQIPTVNAMAIRDHENRMTSGINFGNNICALGVGLSTTSSLRAAISRFVTAAWVLRISSPVTLQLSPEWIFRLWSKGTTLSSWSMVVTNQRCRVVRVWVAFRICFNTFVCCEHFSLAYRTDSAVFC